MLHAKGNADDSDAKEQAENDMGKEHPKASEDKPDDVERKRQASCKCTSRLYALPKGSKAQNGQLETLNTPGYAHNGHA